MIGYTNSNSEGIRADEHTILLLHGDSFEDAGPQHVPITNYGVALNTNNQLFGDGCFYFDNTHTKYFSWPSAYWIPQSNNWTVEYWIYKIYQNSWNHGVGLNMNINGGGASGMIIHGNGQVYLRNSNSGDSWSLSQDCGLNSLATYTWHHVAIVRDGTQLRAYMNGILSSSTTYNSTIGTNSNPHTFGRYYNGTGSSNWGFEGYMQELRISDIPRYSDNFIPQRTPF